ncbi:MAG: DUF167 domain-containing protein [bacterium]|nr:DUF167 domain-containing protein [bacterium]
MIRETADGIVINIKVIPNSSKSSITLEDGFVKLKITAQPIENKANIAVQEFLSKRFKIPKSGVIIQKGCTSKDKTILLRTNDNEKRANILSEFTGKQKGESV